VPLIGCRAEQQLFGHAFDPASASAAKVRVLNDFEGC